MTDEYIRKQYLRREIESYLHEGQEIPLDLIREYNEKYNELTKYIAMELDEEE